MTSVEMVRDGVVKEVDGHSRDMLLDRDEFVNVKEVLLGRDAEAADLGVALVAEKHQL